MAQPKRYMKHPETGAVVAIDPSQWARYRRAGYEFTEAPKPKLEPKAAEAPAPGAAANTTTDAGGPAPLTAADLGKKTKPELVAMATELGLETEGKTKAELVDALVAKTAPAG